MLVLLTVGLSLHALCTWAISHSDVVSAFGDATLIPTVDLNKPFSDIVDAVQRAAEVGGPGFFYITGHGIPESIFQRAVQETHNFHSLPAATKMQISALGYGGGAIPTKGYVPAKVEGAYDKDESDVRPETAHASKMPNTREAFVFRYPEDNNAFGDAPYLSDYEEFLKDLDRTLPMAARCNSSILGSLIQSSRSLRTHAIQGILDSSLCKFSHADNRRTDVETISAAARRFFQRNQWPAHADVPQFQNAVQEYMDHMSRLADNMFSLFEAALNRTMADQPSEGLPHHKGMHTYNFVRYPATDESDGMGIADHSDWEAFTLLYPTYLNTTLATQQGFIDEATGVAFTGLEVWFQDRWVAVPRVPGAIIVNQGEMLSRLSSGRFKPPVHRVRAHSPLERYSLVSFWGPNFELTLPDDEAPFGRVLVGEHYLKRNGLLKKGPPCFQA